METGHDRHMRRVARHPIPSKQEQVVLGRAIRAWQDHPDGPGAAPKDVQRRGKRALDRLVAGNLRLVAGAIRGYLRAGVDVDDLMQAGSEGLIAAARKYDPSTGYTFATYATWWIRQGFQRGALYKMDSIRIPDGICQLAYQARGVAGNLESELGRTPTVKEVADRMGRKANEDQVRKAIEWLERARCSSLSEPVGLGHGDDRLSRLDYIKTEGDAWEEIEEKDAVVRVRDAMRHLSEKDQELVRRVVYEGVTYKKIAEEEGVHREAIRQRWQRVVRKIMYYMGSRDRAGVSGIHSSVRRAHYGTFAA